MLRRDAENSSPNTPVHDDASPVMMARKQPLGLRGSLSPVNNPPASPSSRGKGKKEEKGASSGVEGGPLKDRDEMDALDSQPETRIDLPEQQKADEEETVDAALNTSSQQHWPSDPDYATPTRREETPGSLWRGVLTARANAKLMEHKQLLAERAKGEWLCQTDDTSGRKYWYNTATRESQWEKPLTPRTWARKKASAEMAEEGMDVVEQQTAGSPSDMASPVPASANPRLRKRKRNLRRESRGTVTWSNMNSIISTPSRAARFMNHHLDGILFNTPDQPPPMQLQPDQPGGMQDLGSPAPVVDKRVRKEAPDWLEEKVIQFTLLMSCVMGTILLHMGIWEESYAKSELMLAGLTNSSANMGGF